MARVQQEKHAAEPQVQPEQPTFPAQWFYGLYALSPVTGLFCHRHFAIIVARLSASVGAPGPHDFAVRVGVIRPSPMRNCASEVWCLRTIPE
jgi:hypothetical protein